MAEKVGVYFLGSYYQRHHPRPRKGDDVSYMNDKVKYFPHDLKVSRRIFDLIENVYQQQIAQIFQVAMSAVQLLLALAYALLDGQGRNSDYVV